MMKSALALAVFGILAACSSPGVGGTGDDGSDDPGMPSGGDPINGPGTPTNPVPSSAGPYKVVTHADLSVELILPAQAELVVTTLRTFSTNPGQALLSLPGDAVPAINDLMAVIPSPLTGKVEGWVNGYIDPIEVGGVKLTDAAGTVAGLAQTSLSKVDLDSDLTITEGSAAQKLTAIDLTPAGIDEIIPLDLPNDLVSASTTATYGGSGAQLALGSEDFGFEYGEYAWQAVNNETTKLFGADIRTMLGNAVNCPALGAKIANECVLGVCVGHADIVAGACSAGLDFVVDQMHQKFDSIDITAVQFASGTGTLVDDNGDGVADRITTGAWDAELNVGLGLRPTGATFDASR
jgi:hypothetical protein